MVSKSTVVLAFLFVIQQTHCWVYHHVLSARPGHAPKHRHFLPLSSFMDDWKAPDNYGIDDKPIGDNGSGNTDAKDEDSLTDEELEAMLGDWDERVAKFNTVHLVGRVGNSPETRYVDDGNVVVNLNIACKRKLHYSERKMDDIKFGEEETDWYALEIWGQTAEFVSKFVDKGARIGVVGSLEIDEWTDKETGENRSKAKVIVREFDILETKAEADLRRSNSRGSSFYTADDDDNDNYNPSVGRAGGFFN